MTGIDWPALIVLILLFAAVTVVGFLAARWRQPKDLQSLHEWGLGGKSFGTVVTCPCGIRQSSSAKRMVRS